MKHNRIRYSTRVSLVIALFFVLFSAGLMPAIGQDSSQNPPYGYDQGVWVLKDKTSTIEKDEDNCVYTSVLSVGVESVTAETSWDDACGGRMQWSLLRDLLLDKPAFRPDARHKAKYNRDCQSGRWSKLRR
jgi:hypothetical protein